MLWYPKHALVLQPSLIFIFAKLSGVTPQGYHSYTSVSRHSHFIRQFMLHIFWVLIGTNICIKIVQSSTQGIILWAMIGLHVQERRDHNWASKL